MTCELSSSFSQENRIRASEELWWWTGTGRAEDSNFYFGRGTQVVPMDDEVYTIVGHPGTQTGTGTSPANQGSVYLFRSSSSGIDTEIIIGPGGDDAPSATTGSNYVGLDLSGENWHNANFGVSNAAISSSTGLWLASAAPGLAEYAGQILLFHSTSAGGVQQISDPDQKLTGSVSDANYGTGTQGDSALYSFAGSMKEGSSHGGLDSDTTAIMLGTLGYTSRGKPADGVSLAFDENEQNLYISFYDSVLSDSGTSFSGGFMNGTYNTGGIRLYKSSSAGGIEHLQDITVSSGQLDEQVGSAHEMIVADGKVYIAASATKIYSAVGRAFLFTYDISADTYIEETFAPSAEAGGTNITFGTGTPDIVSGSDGIYILQGAGYRYDTAKTYGGTGRAYLFKSSSSGIDLQLTFSGSTGAQSSNGYDLLGWSSQMVSGANGITVLTHQLLGTPETVSYLDEGTVSDKRHVIWIYETDGSSTNATYRIDESNSSTLNSLSEFGWASEMDARISSDGERLYIASSNPDYSTNTGATILYEWGLSGSCSEQQQQQQQGGQSMSTNKRGLAVYSGSSEAVHKFLDDGSSKIGTGSANMHQVTGTMNITGQLTASSIISASAYHGDGQYLKNISAENVDITNAADADQSYYMPLITGSDDQNNVTFYADSGMTYNPSSNSLSTSVISGSTVTGSELTFTNGTISEQLDVNGDLLVPFGTSSLGDLEVAGAASVDGLATLASVDINAGNIDNTAIGATTPASGDFTTISTTAGATLATAKISDLTDNRVVIAGASGEIEDSADFTFDGSTLEIGATKATALSASGNASIEGTMAVEGAASFDGGATASTMKVSDLTSGRVVLAGTSGEIEDHVDLTYDGSDLNAPSLIVDDLTDNRVLIAGASGAVEDSASLTFDGSTLEVAAVMSASSADVGGTLDVEGAAAFNGGATASSMAVSDLTSGRIVLAGTSGELEDNTNLKFDGSKVTVTGSITASANISASAFYGDGSALTNVSSENVDTTAASANSDYHIPFTSNSGDQNNAIIYSDSDGKLKYNPSQNLLTVEAAQINSNLTVDANAIIRGDENTEVTLDIRPTAGATSDVLNVRSRDTTIAFKVDELGDSTFEDSLTVNGGLTANTAAISDLTSGRVVLAGTSGELEDHANLTYDGSDLNAPSLIVDDLTDNRVLIAGASGAVEDSASLTFDGSTLEVAAVMSASSADVGGTLDVDGAATFDGGVTASSMAVSDLTNGRVVLAGTSGELEDSSFLTFSFDTLTCAGTLSGTLGDFSGDLTVGGNTILGDAEADSTTVYGHQIMSAIDGGTAAGRSKLEELAGTGGDASAYNGSMIYVSTKYNGGSDAFAAFFFDNDEKWYFCENGSWYPSPFNS